MSDDLNEIDSKKGMELNHSGSVKNSNEFSFNKPIINTKKHHNNRDDV